jgi:hypothetical protein
MSLEAGGPREQFRPLPGRWRVIAVHRAAGLLGQLNIETVLQPDAPRPFWLDALLPRVGAVA